MLTEMFPVRFWLMLTVAALSLSPGALSADDQDIQKAGKAVRFVWFPRFSADGKWLITAPRKLGRERRGRSPRVGGRDGQAEIRHPDRTRRADGRVGAEWEIVRVGRLRGKDLLLRRRDGRKKPSR